VRLFKSKTPASAVTDNGRHGEDPGKISTVATPDLPIHPAAEAFPLMSESELRELADDIKTNGLAHAIVRDAGMILDGRNRLAACEIAGVEPRFEEYTGKDPVAYVISANIHRRHLTTDQKREVIAKLLKADPSKSNRWLAAPLGVDGKTVGRVRDQMEARGALPHVAKRTDTKGRKQPARRKKTKRAPPAPAVHLNEVPATPVPANDIMSPVPDGAPIRESGWR
jgi:ParB-like chromosome segregation protein Spo0J